MSKKVLIAAITLIISQSAIAQYVHYEPNPIYIPPPLPPMQLPQTTMPMPRPMMIMPPATTVKPTINIVTKFLIQKAIVNGNDLSQHYINSSAGVVIYTLNQEQLKYMGVVIPGENTSSTGEMLAITQSETPQSTDTFGKTITLFSWNFVNSEDNSKGTATVTWEKEYRTDGTHFSFHIVANNGVTCDFSGISK